MIFSLLFFSMLDDDLITNVPMNKTYRSRLSNKYNKAGGLENVRKPFLVWGWWGGSGLRKNLGLD